MAAHGHTTWHNLCVRTYVCACVCGGVSAHVRAHVIREIKHPFQGNAKSLIMRPYICIESCDFWSCGSMFLF